MRHGLAWLQISGITVTIITIIAIEPDHFGESVLRTIPN